MGWLGQYVGERPNTEELNRMAEDWLTGPGYKTLDRSAWLNHGRHQFVLTEHTSREGKVIRFIAVILLEFSKGELRYKLMDESVGPVEIDCPMRLLKGLEGHPPVNEYSRQWRDNVAEYHRWAKPRRSILRALRKNHPNGEQRAVLNDGRTVQYLQGNYRGRKNVAAYWEPQKGAYLLTPELVDPEATQELWACAHSPVPSEA